MKVFLVVGHQSSTVIDYHNTCDIFQTSVKVKLTKNKQIQRTCCEIAYIIYMFIRQHCFKAINIKNSGSIPRNACSPAKHIYAWLPMKCDYQTDTKTDRQTDRQTPDKMTPMYCYASQATQKLIFFFLNAEHVTALSLLFPKLWSRLMFSKVGQKSWSRSRGQNLWFKQKGHTTRNTY